MWASTEADPDELPYCVAYCVIASAVVQRYNGSWTAEHSLVLWGKEGVRAATLNLAIFFM